MDKIIAGVQAGVVTLIFVLIVAFTNISWATVGWTILIAAIAVVATFVFINGSSIAIAITVLIAGLICTGIFFVSDPRTLIISLIAGILIGLSWSITISYSLSTDGII